MAAGLCSRMQPRPDHGEMSYRGSGRLLGRKALITGGDSGMGRAAAIAFAREGADVAINYLAAEQPDADEVLGLIRQAGRKAEGIPGDIRDENFCRQLVDRSIQAPGGIDILVSNAGRQQAHDSILDISTEQFDWTMKTNIYAPFWIIKAALPHLQPGSSIIATASEQAYDPLPSFYDYAQTKAATMNFGQILAKQLGQGASASTAWRRARSGRRCRSAEVRRRRNRETLEARPRSGVPACRPNWAAFTFCWQTTRVASPMARSTDRREGRGSLDATESHDSSQR